MGGTASSPVTTVTQEVNGLQKLVNDTLIE